MIIYVFFLIATCDRMEKYLLHTKCFCLGMGILAGLHVLPKINVNHGSTLNYPDMSKRYD